MAETLEQIEEQLNRERQQLKEANEKHWNALIKSNDKLLRNWIATNAYLWSTFTDRQQAEILAGGYTWTVKRWGKDKYVPPHRR